MRTTPATPFIAFLWTLLAPVLAFAQADAETQRSVNRSPLFWYWMMVLAVVVALFIWRSVVLSRRRGGPPTTP